MEIVAVLRTLEADLAGVHAKPGVTLGVASEAALGGAPVLSVDYPEPTADPAGRDVRLDAQVTDWKAARGLRLQANPEHELKLSVSFFDRNRVVYTAWTPLRAGVWQSVELPFSSWRPNPYFQPPDAVTGAPLDVSAVPFVAFAPHDPAAGRLRVSQIELVR